MRAFLNTLYRVSGALAAACLCTIAVLVIAQVGGRILDGVMHLFGRSGVGFTVPSLNEIAGFLFVAATFLALAATLRNGDHIRVSMLIRSVSPGLRRVLELTVLAVGAGFACFAAWHAVLLVADSIEFGSVSFGVIAIPLAIPQSALALGLIIFAIALIDDLIATLTGGQPSYQVHEEGRSVGATEAEADHGH